ncbi:MAG: alpha-amylase/4-alpha-glucanotransferase domain-containing protein [Candidatus Omnitrophota bacterium]
MGKVYFLFGVHDHQPVGNFPHIFEEAFDKCYSPFFDILEKYPAIKCNVHISGPLYDWLLSSRKEFIDKLKRLSKKNQLEIISGGYYEPILPIISDEDKSAQIDLMNKFIRNTFGQKARGIWIAERVWEPYLASVIRRAGLEYTFLDDTHFRYAGLNRKEFTGYYTTENSRESVYVFPISKTLRYKIPFSKAQEAIDTLNSFAQDSDVLVTLFDDGEKFGLWPQTFDWVYNKGWLESFFSLLAREKDNIVTLTAKEAVEKFSPRGIVYLPTASYEEMGEWVLEPESFRSYEKLKNCIKNSPDSGSFNNFIRGGFFRNFYTKYPRLNFMHKRMLSLSEKIRAAAAGGDKNALKYLFMAQCNCGYWHGIFGGFYLGHIRSAIYENLIKAEKEFDRKTLKETLSAQIFDMDLDGFQETIIKNDKLIAVLSDRGGAILDFSLKDVDFNLLNTITRREESYHQKIREKVKQESGPVSSIHDTANFKDDNLDKFLVYDNYEKVSLTDHLVHKNLTIESVNSGHSACVFADKAYKNNGITKKKSSLTVKYFYQEDGLSFSKDITFSKGAAFTAEYKFNQRKSLNDYDFAVEFNLFLQSPQDVTFKAGGKDGIPQGESAFSGIDTFAIKDKFKGIYIEFVFDKANVFVKPLFSVSSSESGFERVHQQFTILFVKARKAPVFKLACAVKKEANNF